jgi:ABC-type phosphate transport system ATPase subunit
MEQSEQDVVTNLPRLEPLVTQQAEPGSSAVIFDVKSVSIWYSAFKAVTDVSMSIHEHEITAFIGSSGSGKSTVLRAFKRMNDLVPGARMEGEITYRDESLYGKDVSPVAVRRRIGMVFQKANPFPKSIYDNVAYGPRINGERNKHKLDEIVERSLGQAALWDEVKNRLNKSGLSLSGGQAQRLCIARTLAVEPDVILMDEPRLGARPDRDGPDRGPDEGTQAAVHDRHRHAQHAAGHPGQRPHRLLLRARQPGERYPHGRPGGVRPDRADLLGPARSPYPVLRHRPDRLIRDRNRAFTALTGGEIAVSRRPGRQRPAGSRSGSIIK